jgi:hypothetical protein
MAVGVSMSQLELMYRKAIWTYPTPAHSFRKPMRARVDDGLDYMLKDDDQAPIRAREWICHSLANGAGLPVVEFLPILTAGGRVVFGSRFVLNGGPGGTAAYDLFAGIFQPAHANEVLSAIYAIDLFLGNGDRHQNNFMVELDGAGANRLRVIDFSEASALIEPKRRTDVPTFPCNTVMIGRQLRTLYGFSADSAKLALDRLAGR